VTDQLFAIRVDQLHDGHRFQPGHDHLVVIADGAVLDVGPAGPLGSKYAALPTVRHNRGVLTPGWIDSHAHTTLPGDGSTIEDVAPLPYEDRVRIAAKNLEQHLMGGVTSVRDLGAHLDFLAWQPNPQTMPRLLRYGTPITADRGHMHWFGGAISATRTTADVARDNLRAGADGLKLVGSGGGTVGTIPHQATLSVDQLRAAVDVGHALGRRSTVHALSNEAIVRAARAGADGIEHVGFLTADGDSVLDAHALDVALEAGVTFGSTLGCNEAYLHRPGVGGTEEHREQRERTDYYQHNAGRLLTAGARIAVGSDAGWKHTPFGEFGRELHLLARTGLSSEQIIHLATVGNSRALGAHGVTGQVSPGHPADLVVIDSADFASRPPRVLDVVIGGFRRRSGTR
jgi:imidazolonepropionase-like amidohydrolase